MTERVLITGARAAAALDLARDFAAAGYEVHLADCTPARMARWSRVPKATHRYAPPALDPASFRRDIARLVTELSPRLVIPTCEEVFHLSAPALADALQERLFAPPLATLRRLHDKHAFALACTEWGLPVPEGLLLESRAYLEGLAGNSSEWVFKPPFSRFGESALVGPAAAELAQLAPSPVSPLLAQRRVRGEECCFHAFARDGKLLAFAAYTSRWRLGGGASFAFSPLAEAQTAPLRAIAESLAASAHLTGQFACDAIIDASGQPWLIECNPRGTSGVHLLVGNGDLARAIVSGTPMPEQPAPAPRHLAPAMVLFGLPLALRRGAVAEWRATMRQSRDAISRPGDRLPLAGALVDAAGFALSGLRHGISTTSATTRDIAWNGEELA
ncbi:MAG: hypothetical protein JY451_01010 [Erythrobacter sp.]|nr:MAG: hypothetical protein JY451_01010 [Erythrobacter sp.]